MTQDEAIEWIAELFEEKIENIKPETEKDEIDGWDSLGVLTLMAGLDEKLDMIISEDEILELKKVSDILDILKKYGHLN